MKKQTLVVIFLFQAMLLSPGARLCCAGPAVENPQAAGEISGLKKEIADLRLELVQALARTLEVKDAYTRGHSERARLMAGLTAKELKLPEDAVLDVEYAALLHDIGKITIDKSILLKPGRLTPEEYEEMKKHPSAGYEILASVGFLKNTALMVLHHQEWFNGKGYPQGLKGEEIPMGARIVSVMDAWDAMTSDRPYRKAFSREAALGELKKGAGTQFDPKVVEVFIRVEERVTAGAKPQ